MRAQLVKVQADGFRMELVRQKAGSWATGYLRLRRRARQGELLLLRGTDASWGLCRGGNAMLILRGDEGARIFARKGNLVLILKAI